MILDVGENMEASPHTGSCQIFGHGVYSAALRPANHPGETVNHAHSYLALLSTDSLRNHLHLWYLLVFLIRIRNPWGSSLKVVELSAIYGSSNDSISKMHGLRRAMAAEAYGTFLLTMLGPGTITAMSYVGFASPASLGFVGLAHGVALVVAFYSIGHVSGAHINPAVTISAWATHRVEKRRVLPYIVAQLFGATVAGFALLVLWSSSASTYRVCCSGFSPTYLGDTLPGADFGPVAALIAEVIATAILVFTIFGATDKKGNQSFAGLAIGLVLAAVIWMFGPISGASLNPARTWGPTIASSVFSLTPLANLWIYIVGPILGGLLGAFLYDVVKPEEA